MKPKKVLLLGSGGLKIGEAGEFDYSGSQALKALREEKIETILVNPNIANVQTSEGFTNKKHMYFLPITPEFVEKVIEKEKPDGILLSFGGQTALNCGIALHKKGVLKKHSVKVLGTPIESIEKTEDRNLFKKELESIGIKTPKSFAAKTIGSAMKKVNKIGFPVMVRAAFALGGLGSGIAKNKKELKEILEKAFSFSRQVLIEEYLEGWKEIEYEVVRDVEGNSVTVCNMENIDPLGIHTGESIVVSPSQTLNNREYHYLRELSLKVINHLKILGECNIQFALCSDCGDYRVIEVNARLSRSSALASKATGYPLAFVATKLVLGKKLFEIKNAVTKKTSAFFEPALDYVVVKIPKWDLQKFRRVSTNIGSEMKSVGEVMAIGREFEEALQKAVRMLEIGFQGLTDSNLEFKDLKKELSQPTDKRVFAITEALKKGFTPLQINRLSGINPWFLQRIKNIVDFEKLIATKKLTKKILLRAKQLGFSDKRIESITGKKNVRALRKKLGIIPCVKQIDTLAAEFPAKTNYLYLTYNALKNDSISKSKTLKKKVLVLGSGAYRIGSSVEFDWCAVNTVLQLKKKGYNTVMVNYNPETVSTDYDITDKLYFEELSFERVMDIIEHENPFGVIVSVGGQIPNNLCLKLYKARVNVLGTNPKNIDRAEDRKKFSKLCDSLGIAQPEWKQFSRIENALNFALKVGYPVLVRPSYVLSGSAMSIAFNSKQLKSYLKKAVLISKDKPVVISKFITNAKELEIDAVANKGQLVCWALTEHIENAGVHSGDATMVLPPQTVYLETLRQIKIIAKKLAKALNISGPFNVQFIAKENKVKVIECNLRASRSFPFVSKVTGNNFIEYSTEAMLKIKPKKIFSSSLEMDFVGVKAPQFSFSRLKGADPVLSVEMASTGEVACLSTNFYDALLKSIISTGFAIPKKNFLLSVSGDKNRFEILTEVRALQKLGFKVYATDSTHKFLKENNVKNSFIYKVSENRKPNIKDYLLKGKIELAIVISEEHSEKEVKDEFFIRRSATDHSVPLITNLQLAKLFLKAITKNKDFDKDFEIHPWAFYS